MRPWFPFLLSFLMLLPVFTQAAPASPQALLELMDVSGIDVQLSNYPESLRSAMIQDIGGRLPAGPQLDQRVQVFEGTVLAHDFRGEMEEALGASFSEAEVRELIAWYHTDLGHRITTAEKAASTPKAQSEMLRRADALLLSTERVAIAQRMDAIVGVTEIYLAMQEEIARTLVYSLTDDAYQRERSQGALEHELEVTAAERRAGLQKLNTVAFVYAYKKLPMSDLQSYVEWLELPVARRFHEVNINTIAASTQTVLRAFLDGLEGGGGAGQQTMGAHH